MDRLIVVFDGECNLCSTTVQFLLRHDANGRMEFAARQSAVGQQLLQEAQVEHVESVVVLDGARVLTESSAAIRMAREFTWPWRAASWVVIIPRPLRDWGYRVIAARRYALFGKHTECWLPTPELRQRFLDQQ